MAINTIESPMPGIFYTRASPSDPPLKQPGDTVAVGDSIGLIEVMKSFMPIHATAAGRLVRFLVEDQASVDVGDPICEVEG